MGQPEPFATGPAERTDAAQEDTPVGFAHPFGKPPRRAATGDTRYQANVGEARADRAALGVEREGDTGHERAAM